MKRARVNLKDIVGRSDENPFKRFLPPTDERLLKLMADVKRKGRQAGGPPPAWRSWTSTTSRTEARDEPAARLG